MRLKPEEREALNSRGVVKLWRFAEPTASEPRQRYTSDGAVYTVLDKKRLTASDVMRTQPQSTFQALRISWPEDATHVWLIAITLGDHTDRPRLMQPTGRKSGDYTDRPELAMQDEPEAVSERENEDFAAEARAIRDERLRELGEVGQRGVNDQLGRAGLRRKERRKLRFVQHALRKLNQGDR
jgi:hypothetical protein